MAVSLNATACCACGSPELDRILDFGPQPDPDWLLEPSDPEPAPEAPVHLAICGSCTLLQLTGPRPEGPPPPHGHAMSIPTGDPWVATIKRSMNAESAVVLDLDGTSGLPADDLCGAGAVGSGLMFDRANQAGLILVGHALTHADDIGALLGKIEGALAPKGLLAIDFHHALGIVNGQFDVVSHTHRSYLTLHSLESVLARHGLGVIAVQRIKEYGGTIRVLAARKSDSLEVNWDASVRHQVLESERAERVDRASGYAGLDKQILDACARLIDFLDDGARAGRSIAGYGAAARGTVLLNLAGVEADRLSFIVDRAQPKQGRLLPRARIPVVAPSVFDSEMPDDILILPWPVSDQIVEQLSAARAHRPRFVVALPRLEYLT
jgi:C-methyltransferase-like protein/putative zinc binding protein